MFAISRIALTPKVTLELQWGMQDLVLILLILLALVLRMLVVTLTSY
jgi:hypothetical protein